MIREKILESETTVSRVNYSTIASLAETTEQALVITLKQILQTINDIIRCSSTRVKLNMKVGFLKFSQGSMSFDNYATAQEIDQITITTLGSQRSKVISPRCGGSVIVSPMNNHEPEDETLKEALSRITETPKITPRGSMKEPKSAQMHQSFFSNTFDKKPSEKYKQV